MTFPSKITAVTGKQILFDFINLHETFTRQQVILEFRKHAEDALAQTTIDKTLRMLWLANYINKTAPATWERVRQIPASLSISKLTDEAYGSDDLSDTYRRNAERIRKQSNNRFQ